MTKFLNNLNLLWNKFILRLRGELVIAFFIVFHFLVPLINITRALFNLKFTLLFLGFLVLNVLFIYLIFKIYPKIYCKVLTLIFGDFLTNYKHIVSFGAFLIKEWPLIFGCYVILSSVSFLYSRENPEIFWIYLIYCLCVCFRNVFLIPFLGYSIITNINKKKTQLLMEKDILGDIMIPLVLNTSLVKDLNFCYNFLEWAKLVIALKPPLNSVKKTSRMTLPTLGLVYLNFFSLKRCCYVLQRYNENKKTFDNCISEILNDKTSTFNELPFLLKIAQKLDFEMKSLPTIIDPEMKSSMLGFYFFFNQKEILKIFTKSYRLSIHSETLLFCYSSKLDCLESRLLLLKLIENLENEGVFIENAASMSLEILDSLDFSEKTPRYFSKSKNVLQDQDSIQGTPEISSYLEQFFKLSKLIRQFVKTII